MQVMQWMLNEARNSVAKFHSTILRRQATNRGQLWVRIFVPEIVYDIPWPLDYVHANALQWAENFENMQTSKNILLLKKTFWQCNRGFLSTLRP